MLVIASLNDVADTLSSTPTQIYPSVAGSYANVIPVGNKRYAVAVNTVVRLVALTNFTGGTITGRGVISARRRR